MKPLSPSMWTAALALAGLATALPAAAQFAKPEDAIKYRKSVMFVMQTHVGRLAGMANGKIPFDAKLAADSADVAAMMSKLPFAAFVEGSDKGGDTRAKPEIWTEMDKFKTGATRMQEEMAKLNLAAKGGSLDAIRAAVGETGKACKSCHDNYRKD